MTRRWKLVVTDIEDVRFILDNSPSIFGVGLDKKEVFAFFMKQNVGISTPEDWSHRRALNEYILEVLPSTDWIADLLETSRWDSFQSVSRDMERIGMRLVFGPQFTQDMPRIWLDRSVRFYSTETGREGPVSCHQCPLHYFVYLFLVRPPTQSVGLFWYPSDFVDEVSESCDRFIFRSGQIVFEQG